MNTIIVSITAILFFIIICLVTRFAHPRSGWMESLTVAFFNTFIVITLGITLSRYNELCKRDWERYKAQQEEKQKQ